MRERTAACWRELGIEKALIATNARMPVTPAYNPGAYLPDIFMGEVLLPLVGTRGINVKVRS
jgi:hypothetical protein